MEVHLAVQGNVRRLPCSQAVHAAWENYCVDCHDNMCGGFTLGKSSEELPLALNIELAGKLRAVKIEPTQESPVICGHEQTGVRGALATYLGYSALGGG